MSCSTGALGDPNVEYALPRDAGKAATASTKVHDIAIDATAGATSDSCEV